MCESSKHAGMACIESAFERGAGHGLLELGIRKVGTALPADFAYRREFAGRYVTVLSMYVCAIGLVDESIA
jgi:hypothetical protein